MAYFTKKTWKDRLVEFAGRRILKNVGTNESVTYDVTRSEGAVSQEGDAFSPANMNDMEQRIADGFSAVEEDYTQLSSELTNLVHVSNVVVAENVSISGENASSRNLTVDIPDGYKLASITAYSTDWRILCSIAKASDTAYVVSTKSITSSTVTVSIHVVVCFVKAL